MIATPQPQTMSIDQYLAWEPLQVCRYEYINGKVFAMTGGTIPHNDSELGEYGWQQYTEVKTVTIKL
jgi:Uma2 family endonuclease